ncbi:acetoacetate--CoA ligase [Candidatus Neomarinimicrobiota bacterium]
MDNPLKKILWKPTKNQIQDSQMTRFTEFVHYHHRLSMQNYDELHNWSVENIADFWQTFWDFSKIIHTGKIESVIDNDSKMPGAKWFSNIKLNFSENLLRYRDGKIALIFKGEGRKPQNITYKQLFDKVSILASAMRNAGVQPGDRIAGFLPNMPITVIAMLATASIGAVWSSCSPDFGIKGVLDRFQQIKPKILFTVDGYNYNGKKFNYLDKVKQIAEQLPSLKYVVVNPYISHSVELTEIPNGINYQHFIKNNKSKKIHFEQLPFDHPLYIMYSSGTTGMPKAIVHGAGGTLVQHLKELRLHTNLTRDDTIFYFTTCGWMMWNWLVSSLAIGATVVLYDGSPFYHDGNAMWDLTDELGITVLGTSAKYIASCEAAGIRPIVNNKLSNLRTILSTGSPLMNESFDYIYTNVKKDVMLSSIAGGTDIISCFVLGNPNLPVYRGEIQCKGLGMNVHVFSENGKSLINKLGELVCTSPFPSMPIYFWNDPDGQKYRKTYFEEFPNIWHHGDYISISRHGGVTMHGRSDATLNPGGIRIGTSEIYRVVENLPAIDDSLVIGQEWQGDERVILFIKLNAGFILNDDLKSNISYAIKSNCSPRHVPSKILETPDIPYTINGKKVEIAVKKIIAGKYISNRDALANPESLDYFRDIPELLK